jgi:hypothetical protein
MNNTDKLLVGFFIGFIALILFCVACYYYGEITYANTAEAYFAEHGAFDVNCNDIEILGNTINGVKYHKVICKGYKTMNGCSEMIDERILVGINGHLMFGCNRTPEVCKK